MGVCAVVLHSSRIKIRVTEHASHKERPTERGIDSTREADRFPAATVGPAFDSGVMIGTILTRYWDKSPDRKGWVASGCDSVRLFPNLFSGTLARQGLLYPTLGARLEVEGMTLHLFNDVFRLNLALEPPQGILDGLTLLQSNFCQIITPSQN